MKTLSFSPTENIMETNETEAQGACLHEGY